MASVLAGSPWRMATMACVGLALAFSLLAVHGQPARIDDDFAVGLEFLSCSTVVMRVVISNCAAGKKTAIKRRATMSKSFCSVSERFLGTVPVGTMAK